VDGVGDERARDHTCANQTLISRLHTRITIATKAKTYQKALHH
jgi:hypothetical protein